jgi:peptidoglycan/xylan/chitin deacetylase (PgdA/CDA1 family)
MAAVHALYYSGVLSVLQAIRLRQRAVVLMYHRVLTAEQQREVGSNPGIVITRDTFERQMAYLKRAFNVLSVGEFAHHIRDGVPFADSSCLITFDDGWRDNFENAWPVLHAESLPAVIFLPVNYVGTSRSFWRETLTRLLAHIVDETRRRPERRKIYAAILQRADLAAVLDLPGADPRAAISEALDPLKGRRIDEVNALVKALASAAAVNATELTAADRFMNWAEAEAMSRDGIAFGGHGAEHRLLGQIPEREVDDEVITMTAVMNKRLPAPVPSISYPNGSWTPAVIEKVRRAGIALGFTTEPGTVSVGDEPLTIRRVNISEDMTRTTPMFLARILGLV